MSDSHAPAQPPSASNRERGIEIMRDVAGETVKVLIESLIRAAGRKGDKLSGEDIKRVGEAFLDHKAALDQVYGKAYDVLSENERLAALVNQRGEPFHRLLVHNFSFLLNDERSGITRPLLPRFFTAVRLMLGEEGIKAAQVACRDIFAKVPPAADGRASWEAFYKLPAAVTVLEDALAQIAKTFAKFDARRHWFQTVMESDLHDISLSAHVFVPKKSTGTKAHEFGDREFFLMMKGLFVSVRDHHLDDARRKAFAQRHGQEPADFFADFFINLSRFGNLG